MRTIRRGRDVAGNRNRRVCTFLDRWRVVVAISGTTKGEMADHLSLAVLAAHDSSQRRLVNWVGMEKTMPQPLPIITFRRYSDGPYQSERTGAFDLQGNRLPDDLGSVIRHARKAQGRTLEALGAIVGTTKSHIWEIENGHTPSPRFHLMMSICSALNLDPRGMHEMLTPAVKSDPLEGR